MQLKNTAFVVAVVLVLQLFFLETTAYIRQSYWSRDRISTLKSDYLINLRLDELLTDLPTASRARVELIEAAIHTPSRQLPLYRFSTKFAKAAPNKDPGVLITDLPLSGWNDFLPDLIDKQCVTRQTSQIQSSFLVPGTFIACPMVDTRGVLIGALFVSWDEGKQIDHNAIFEIRDSAAHITDYLERRYIDNLLDDIVLEQYR